MHNKLHIPRQCSIVVQPVTFWNRKLWAHSHLCTTTPGPLWTRRTHSRLRAEHTCSKHCLQPVGKRAPFEQPLTIHIITLGAPARQLHRLHKPLPVAPDTDQCPLPGRCKPTQTLCHVAQ